MLQMVTECFVQSGQNFTTPASKIFAMERLRTLVMSASSAASKSFKKHITPQLNLMAPAFRLNVRMPPVEQAIYTRDFFGVTVGKYSYM